MAVHFAPPRRALLLLGAAALLCAHVRGARAEDPSPPPAAATDAAAAPPPPREAGATPTQTPTTTPTPTQTPPAAQTDPAAQTPPHAAPPSCPLPAGSGFNELVAAAKVLMGEPTAAALERGQRCLIDAMAATAPVLGTLADLAEARGDAVQALALAQVMEFVAPKSGDVKLALSRRLVNANLTLEALPRLQQLADENPTNAAVHDLLGISLYREGNVEAARQELRVASSLDERPGKPAEKHLSELEAAVAARAEKSDAEEQKEGAAAGEEGAPEGGK